MEGDDENYYNYDGIYNYDFNLTGELDYQNIPYIGVIKKLPLYEIVLKSYIYAMIIFFSLVGNTLIIVVVLRHKQMRTTTNFYIVNLAVADILVTVYCTWVHLVNNLNNNNWVLGEFFCKFNTFSQVFCLIASVLSLTLIAYDRFFGIVFALKAHMSNRKARFSIAVIWLAAFAIASPLLWFRELKVRQWKDYTERWCDDSWPVEIKTEPGTNFTVKHMPARTIYFTFVSAVLYFFPMIVMTLAYSVIIMKLRASTMPGERVDAGFTAQQKTKRKVIAMLVTIMAVFGVCWLPYQIVLLYSELRETRETLGEWYFTMQFLAGCFAYSNSALNPLIYAGFNKNFKQALLNMKSDVLTWHTHQLSTIPSMRRFSLPEFRRRSKSMDIYIGSKHSSKSRRENLLLCMMNGQSPRNKRGMCIDSSPIMTILNPSPDIFLQPKQKDTFKVEFEDNIMAWQPKQILAEEQKSLLDVKSPLCRSKTQKKYQDVTDKEDEPDPILRRHSVGLRGVWVAVNCRNTPVTMDPKTYGTYHSSTSATHL